MQFYDGDGLRISRKDNVSGITTYYVWDDQNPTGYPQVIEEIENNQVVRRYGYGLFLENVDIWNGTSFDRFYVVRDGTNSVRMLLDSAGNVAAEYDYDAFGNVLRSTINAPLSTQNSYGFHSEFRDPTTGLVYLRARWYEPREGRFLCKDEFEGEKENPITLNKYLGFNNNPVNLTDPEGYEGIIGPTGKRISQLLRGIVQVGDLVEIERKDYSYRFQKNIEGNLNIILGAKVGKVEVGTEYRWVQYVTTNDPLGNMTPNIPYNDPQPPDDSKPYYYTDSEIQQLRPSWQGYDTVFEDHPKRRPLLYPVIWDAELFLVRVWPVGSNNYTKVVKIEYGFELTHASFTKHPLIINYTGD